MPPVPTVSNTLKRVEQTGGAGQGVLTQPIAGHMKQVQAFLQLAGKSAITKDFSGLIQLIETRPSLEFASSKSWHNEVHRLARPPCRSCQRTST